MSSGCKSARRFRKRRNSSDSEEEDGKSPRGSGDQNITSILESAKEMHKLRKRSNGLDAATLLVSRKKAGAAESRKDPFDPFKMETGGFVDMKSLARNMTSGQDDSDEEDEAVGFAAETNKRDEDYNMLKYIDEEMARRRGVPQLDEEPTSPKESSQFKKLQDNLSSLPDYLQPNKRTEENEDMVGTEMLSGIPEVDLGIEAKIRNIEATEEAKLKLMKEERARRAKRKEAANNPVAALTTPSDDKEENVSSLVPSNVAVNFVQHTRYKMPKIHRGPFRPYWQRRTNKDKAAAAEMERDKGPRVGDVVD